MPATATGRGAQVVLDGDAQAAARGAYSAHMRGNANKMASLVLTGLAPDGSTADGSTRTGQPPPDVYSDLNTGLYARPQRRVRLTIPAGFDDNAQLAAFSTTGLKSTLYKLPAECDWVRLIMRSTNVTGAMTIKAFVAPTSQIGNGWSAYDAAGVANVTTQWTAVTFTAGCLDVAPEDQTAGTTTGTVPNDNEYYFSDWIAPANLARIDGGEGRLFLVRAQATANPSGVQVPGAGGIVADAANLAYTSSTWATTSSSISTLTATDFVANTISPVWAIQAYSRKAGFTLLTCGSSISAGTTTVNNRSSWSRIACRQASIDTGIMLQPYFNYDFVTPTTAAWVPEATKTIKALHPDIVCLQVANRNDPITAAQQDITWAKVIALAELVRGYGGKPVLVTASPWPAADAPTATEDGYRQINNDRARGLGLPLFDLDAALTDGGSPARLLGAYNDSGDATHPGDTGHAYAATLIAPVLRQLVML